MSDAYEDEVLETVASDEGTPGDNPEDELGELTGPDGSQHQWLEETLVTAPVVHGDRNFTAGRDIILDRHPRPVLGPETSADITRRRATYVRVDAYNQLIESLQERPVQVLRGPAESGRYTTALLALDQLAPEVVSLQINASRELDDVIADRRGHLVEHPNSPTRTELASLRHIAHRAGALIIFLVKEQPTTRLTLDPIDVVPYTPPDKAKVVWSHLGELLPPDRAMTVQQSLETGRLADAFALALKARSSIGHIVELAEVVRAYALNEVTEEYLITSLTDNQRVEIRDWLDGATDSTQGGTGIPSLSDAALLLATTVLNRFPLRYVIPAAERLALHLQHLETPNGTRVRRVFHDSLGACDDWLKVNDSYAWEPQVPGRHTRRVQLHTDNLRLIILEVVWRHFVTLHEPLADWLRWIAEEFGASFGRADEAFLRKVAEVITVLATLDFEQVHRLMLSPWARTENDRLSRVAVAALVTTSRKHSTAAAARLALHEWADRNSSQARQKAALRAYELGISALFPSSIRDLIDLSYRLDNNVQRAIPALTTLLNSGAARLVLQAFALQRESDLHARPAPHVVRCLLDLHDHAPDSLAREFLNTVANQRWRVDVVARILTVALTQDETAGRAWALIRDWIERAEGQPGLVPPLVELLGALASDWHLRARLRFFLTLWTRQFHLSDSIVKTIRSRIDRALPEGSNGHGATRSA